MRWYHRFQYIFLNSLSFNNIDERLDLDSMRNMDGISPGDLVAVQGVGYVL